MPLGLGAGMLGAALVNVTVYRTTPINYTGVTNMDTGDQYGGLLLGCDARVVQHGWLLRGRRCMETRSSGPALPVMTQ